VLGRNGIAADKGRNANSEGRFSVDVGRGDVSYALSLMAREELPPRSPEELIEGSSGSAFIPSRADEQARLQLRTTRQLERSLLSVEGIIAARVHLAAPRSNPLGGDPTLVAPSASVLLKHRGAAPPLAGADVARLVAGAVPGLTVSRVTVVEQAVGDPPGRAGTELVRLGPLTTTRSSLPYLRWMIACVATLNASMVALLFALWLRAKRIRNADAQSRSVTGAIGQR
jgi:type III secretion protein J